MFGNLDQLTSLLAEFPNEKIIVYEFQNGGQTIASTVFQSYQVQTLHLIAKYSCMCVVHVNHTEALHLATQCFCGLTVSLEMQ